MSKTIVISDTHGKSIKEIYLRFNELDTKYDNIVLLGDYVDNFDTKISGREQIRHFQEIIEIAKKDSRVHLLMGNHDLMYIVGYIPPYRGFQKEYANDIAKVINENIELFNIVWKGNKYTYSHAGISKKFMELNEYKDIEEINQAFREKRYSKFEVYDERVEDWERYTPTMMRFDTLCNDYWCENQIVGHTELPCITIEEGNIWCIETFEHGNMAIVTE